MRTIRLLMIGALALTLAACADAAPPVAGDGDCPTEGGVESPNPRPSSTGTIEVISPEQNERVVGDSVVVQVEIDGACVLVEATTSVRPDTGHVHIELDGKTITQLAGKEYEVTGLEPGSHTLVVEFAAGDHLPFNPPVTRTIRFRVVPE